MLKDSSPATEYDMEEIHAIAREAPQRLPGLAPLGGPRWTREDTDLAISFLYQETEGRAYQRATAGGMTRGQRRRWLLMALRNRLLKLKAASRRIDLLDDLALDRLPCSDGRPVGLPSDDAAVLAARVLAKIRTQDTAVLADRLHQAGLLARSSASLQADGQLRQHRGYRWANIREVIRAEARRRGLRREECLALLVALADTMTGGGAVGVTVCGIPRISSPPKD